jgi:predicted GNAT family acetyltransferase
MHHELSACYPFAMGTTVGRWSSAPDFLAAAHDFLAAREAAHGLLLGIAATVANHPDVYRESRFWTVHEAERVVAAALRTPPHNLILSLVDEPRWLAALAADVLASDELPGVLGPTAAARVIADAWSARTGRAAVRVAQERIFRLDRVIPPRPAPGRWREAAEGDRALLAAWWAAFHAEALPDAPSGDAAEAADRMLRRAGRVAYLWEDAGEVVALAGAAGPTPGGIRIGPVYTPPDRRGRGYASNLVAQVSQHQLDAGRSFCFLFTDLANPTSNHIYQAIGYAPVVDVDQYRFPS